MSTLVHYFQIAIFLNVTPRVILYHPPLLVSNAIQVASIFSPLKGRRLLWPTYRLCAPFGRDSRQYDDPPRRTRTRNGDAPRNRDHGGRACPSNSLLELRLSQVRGNGGKSARDRRPPLSLRRAGPTKLEQVLPTIGGKSVNFPSVAKRERRLLKFWEEGRRRNVFNVGKNF